MRRWVFRIVGVLVSAHRTSSCFPSNQEPCHFQDASSVAERLILLQTIFLWYLAVLHRDETVLHNLERNLVLNFLDFEAGCSFVLNDECFDLIVRFVACPNYG